MQYSTNCRCLKLACSGIGQPSESVLFCQLGGQTTICNIDRASQIAVILAVVMAACYFSATYVLLICKLRSYHKLAYTVVQSDIVFNTLQVIKHAFSMSGIYVQIRLHGVKSKEKRKDSFVSIILTRSHVLFQLVRMMSLHGMHSCVKRCCLEHIAGQQQEVKGSCKHFGIVSDACIVLPGIWVPWLPWTDHPDVHVMLSMLCWQWQTQPFRFLRCHNIHCFFAVHSRLT